MAWFRSRRKPGHGKEVIALLNRWPPQQGRQISGNRRGSPFKKMEYYATISMNSFVGGSELREIRKEGSGCRLQEHQGFLFPGPSALHSPWPPSVICSRQHQAWMRRWPTAPHLAPHQGPRMSHPNPYPTPNPNAATNVWKTVQRWDCAGSDDEGWRHSQKEDSRYTTHMGSLVE